MGLHRRPSFPLPLAPLPGSEVVPSDLARDPRVAPPFLLIFRFRRSSSRGLDDLGLKGDRPLRVYRRVPQGDHRGLVVFLALVRLVRGAAGAHAEDDSVGLPEPGPRAVVRREGPGQEEVGVEGAGGARGLVDEPEDVRVGVEELEDRGTVALFFFFFFFFSSFGKEGEVEVFEKG